VLSQAIADAVRTSLGPRGMDKLVVKADGSTLISNDGATILKSINVLHPAAKMLVELASAQDIAAGDGTTTVTVLAGALLEACGALLEKGIHPGVIATSFLSAANKACQILEQSPASISIDLTDRNALLNAVQTCLSSKVVFENADLLAPIAVDSVLSLLTPEQLSAPSTIPEGMESTHGSFHRSRFPLVDLRDIRIVEQAGGTIDDTELVPGLVLTKGASKTAANAVSTVRNARIALLQYCLTAPKTDMDNTVVVSDYAAMDRILREERKYILEQCKMIKKSGANVVLIQKSILRDAYNELTLHFLAKMGILVVTDIERPDISFVCRTLGCIPVAHPDQLAPDKLGSAELVQDIYMEGGSNKVVKFTGVANPGHTCTVLLRGSNELVLQEAARSLHDAQCVVRSLIQQRALTAGGGAAEIEVALKLKEYAVTLTGKDAYCFAAFADAMEVIPYTLAENGGMKPIEVVTELRAKHSAGHASMGINVKKSIVDDMHSLKVVQPLLVTTSAIRLATETVAMILKIDDIVVIQ
jgi:T-complex protein 1 subunit delta